MTIKVLHVIESLDAGGAEKVLVDIVNNLPETAISTVCCLTHSGVMSERIKYMNIEIIELNKGRGNDFTIPFKLKKLLQKYEIDVVHAHNWNTYCESIIAVKLAGTNGIIHTIHGRHFTYPTSFSGRIKKNFRNWLERYLSRFTGKICTVSGAIKDYINSEIGISEKKLEIVLNGVAVEPIAEELENNEKTISNDNKITFCFVGRLETVKNIDGLLFAMAQVIEKIPSAQLLIVGDGSERANLEQISYRNGLTESVTFTGFRNDTEKILRASDIFVLPSHYEGISLALLEAMAVGLPQVVTDVGGNSEIVDDHRTGLVVEPDSIELLAESMISLCLDSDSRIVMRKNSIEKISKLFSISRVAEKYYRLYLESDQSKKE